MMYSIEQEERLTEVSCLEQCTPDRQHTLVSCDSRESSSHEENCNSNLY